MLRHPEYDHPTALMVELLCDTCGQGCKDETPSYFDKRGRRLDSFAFYERPASRPPRARRRKP